MSVVRGRPPGFAGGMNGSIRRYWSSLRAWPEPKSPTSARTSGVHIAASGKGVSPIRTAINITVHPRSNGGGCTFKTGSKRTALTGTIEPNHGKANLSQWFQEWVKLLDKRIIAAVKDECRNF